MSPKEKVVPKSLIQFRHPFTAIIAGPSGSGKTQLVRKILENHGHTIDGVNKSIINVVWGFGKWQNLYQNPLNNVDIKFIEGVPNEEDIDEYDIIVLDDLMNEIKNDKFVLDLFTKGAHHDNQSVIMLTQNLYHKGTIMRDLNLNSNYIVMFRNPRDREQIKTISRQIFGSSRKMLEAYDIATSESYGYLLVDLKQGTPFELMLRTRIVPTDKTQYKFKPIAFE